MYIRRRRNTTQGNMANIYNNTDNLYWVYTAYGKERLSSLQTNDLLKLYNIRIGSYDWYEDPRSILGGTYSEAAFKAYFQSGETVALGSEIENGSFPITGKALDEKTFCVTLTSTIDENRGGFDVREIGIYETLDDNTEVLFAVCTMQPLPKPSVETNHYISSQINCRLFSRLLADNYDKILLDPTNNYATAEEIKEFQQTLLFVESNLASQISNNSQIIGYNRPEQLYQLILDDKKKYSSFGASSTYASFLNATSLANVQSFWVFNYTNDVTRLVSIADLSNYGLYLSTDQLSTMYERGYEGLASWLNFNERHYYTLDKDVKFSLLKDGKDTKFTFFFVGAQNNNKHDCTLLAKDNEFAEHPGFHIKVLKNRSLQVRFYTNRSNYVTFTTPENSIPRAGEFYVMSISYNADVEQNNPMIKVVINGINVAVNSTYAEGYRYAGMSEDGMNMPLFSFIRTQDGDIDYADSKICIMSLVKDDLSDEYVRAMSYNMMALIGKDPCLI